MVITDSHRKRMVDNEVQAEKLKDHASKRGEHLKKLQPLEELIRHHAPLPITYDVGRVQPPFFTEFTYTEMLGALIVQPMSTEVSVRLMVEALEAPFKNDFDVTDHIQVRDKYNLSETEHQYKKVVFLPGTNMFRMGVSKENLTRLMFEDSEVMLKQHPLTDPALTRHLGIMFGYERLLGSDTSGAQLLQNSEEIWVTTFTELGLYGILNKKRVHNISNFPLEHTGTFYAFYKTLWGQDPDAACERLRLLLNNPLSGFFHPNDPLVEQKIKAYFNAAMMWRMAYKPLVPECSNEEWAMVTVNRMNLFEPARVKKNDLPQGK